MTAWPFSRQQLEGPGRAAALSLVDEIIAALVSWAENGTGATDLAAVALVVATVSTRCELDLDLSVFLQKVLDASSAAPMTMTWSGALEYGLSLQSALRIFGVDEDPCDAIDEGLAATVSTSRGTAFDVTDGAVGRLLYLLERPATPQNERTRRLLLTQLAERAWDQTGPLNLGVAHGVAGVVSVLAAVIARGWGERGDEALLMRCTEQLLAHEASGPPPYRFPYTAGGQAGRLAWCYGDLGISVALLQASRALGRADWERVAQTTAESAARVDLEASKVVDASLCHGAIGAGVVLGWLAQQLQSQAVRDAAVSWFERAALFGRPEGRFAGFQFKVPTGWEDNVSILEGAAGVALGLEAACQAEQPAWQRYVLLLHDARR